MQQWQGQKPAYTLSEVRRLIDDQRVLVRWDVLQDAQDDFGWDRNDILAALRELRRRDFYKTEVSEVKPPIMPDFYKAQDLRGERVYTHFYVEEDTLVINSFKQLDEEEWT